MDVTGDTTRGLASTSAVSSKSPLAFRGEEEPNRRASAWDHLDGTPAFRPSFFFSPQGAWPPKYHQQFSPPSLLLLLLPLLLGCLVPNGCNAWQGINPESLEHTVGASPT